MNDKMELRVCTYKQVTHSLPQTEETCSPGLVRDVTDSETITYFYSTF